MKSSASIAATRRQGYESVNSRLVLVPESLYVGFMDRNNPPKNASSGGRNRW